MSGMTYDEIGYWSEIKLDIIQKYASAYSIINTRQQFIKKHIYIDAFAGAGKHFSKTSQDFVPGSPINAINIHPPFKEYHLIDLKGNKVEGLRTLIGNREDIFFYSKDANSILVNDIFPRCRYEDYHRALCILDPYSLNVDWKVIETAGKMGTVEIFYNFMIMDANMNILWRKSDGVDAKQIERMDRVWGDHTWESAAYTEHPTLFDFTIKRKNSNEVIIEALKNRLKEVAGFKYVPEPIPMRNQNGATIYYLFFASPNRTGASIVNQIFDSYRSRGT